MSAPRDFSRRYRAAADDFKHHAVELDAARARIAANRARLDRETRLFCRLFWSVSGIAGIGLLAFIAWMARH